MSRDRGAQTLLLHWLLANLHAGAELNRWHCSDFILITAEGMDKIMCGMLCTFSHCSELPLWCSLLQRACDCVLVSKKSRLKKRRMNF